MKARSLRTSIALAFFAVIVILGVSVMALGYYVIRTYVYDGAQERVRGDLEAAHAVFEAEMERLAQAFSLVSHIGNQAELKNRLGLDYLFVHQTGDSGPVPSGIVAQALLGNPVGGVRVIEADELRAMGNALYEQARIDVKPTPKARPSERTRLEAAMVMEYALPFIDSTGHVKRVLYGGRIINRHHELVDRIRDMVYEQRLHKGKAMGTVTMFLDDVRIATNVLDEQGRRAVGTRVSEAVYANVVERGNAWQSRAFVVTDWYLTSYEPIRDINGNVIGILYVGILEEPFNEVQRQLLLALLAIIGLGILVASGLSIYLSWSVSRPVTDLFRATERLAQGDLSHRMGRTAGVRELAALLGAFDSMAAKLKERDDSLRVTNEKLEAMNKTYLDLVGMVSHELKGILATTMLNAYSVRDGFLGLVNFKQTKALGSITRNLEYFDATVKNFLNLSRIEKNELSLHVTPYELRADVVDAAIEAYARQAHERGITIRNEVAPSLSLAGDASLVQIVFNNLIGNAVKYGRNNGTIAVRAEDEGALVSIEVYNDGRPLTGEECGGLFRRFSRLDSPEGRRVRGTGIGLFITREIVERHGGTITVVPREEGNAFVFTLLKEQPTVEAGMAPQRS